MKDMLGTLIRKIVDLPLETLGTLCDLVEKLLSETGQSWLVELRKFLRKEKCWTGIVKDIFLNLISAGHLLVIDACDGVEVIAGSDDMFEAGIDSDFKDYKADELGQATGETPVEVYEMTKDGTFTQLFGSLSGDISKLCLTQAQIKGFVRKYKSWLRTDGYGTFFLFKSHGHFFVARVGVNSDGRLGVGVLRFEDDYVWDAEYRHRIVVPRLAETL
ncbi:MAG: hypothetical protein WC678_03040 [Parcubacteria group bacterium]|jgi:hypothetical protein